jgi:hypothetical protein
MKESRQVRRPDSLSEGLIRPAFGEGLRRSMIACCGVMSIACKFPLGKHKTPICAGLSAKCST